MDSIINVNDLTIEQLKAALKAKQAEKKAVKKGSSKERYAKAMAQYEYLENKSLQTIRKANARLDKIAKRKEALRARMGETNVESE
jgi:hypothetical protein